MKPQTYTKLWRIAIAIWFGIGLAMIVAALVLQSTGHEEGKTIAAIWAIHPVLTPIIFMIYNYFESRYYDKYYQQRNNRK